jgi:hypothetical protein
MYIRIPDNYANCTWKVWKMIQAANVNRTLLWNRSINISSDVLMQIRSKMITEFLVKIFSSHCVRLYETQHHYVPDGRFPPSLPSNYCNYWVVIWKVGNHVHNQRQINSTMSVSGRDLLTLRFGICLGGTKIIRTMIDNLANSRCNTITTSDSSVSQQSGVNRWWDGTENLERRRFVTAGGPRCTTGDGTVVRWRTWAMKNRESRTCVGKTDGICASVAHFLCRCSCRRGRRCCTDAHRGSIYGEFTRCQVHNAIIGDGGVLFTKFKVCTLDRRRKSMVKW